MRKVLLDDQGRKRCPKCAEYKDLSKYSPQPKKAFGVNPWCKECVAKAVSERYSLDYHRDYHLKNTYGITVEEYNKMLLDQNGVCACCGEKEIIRVGRTQRTTDNVPTLHVDHDHVTGAVRGLLCSSCNTALGSLKENPERVKALLKYIEERCISSKEESTNG